MELVPQLNAEEIRGLFAPPPWGDKVPPSAFCMTNVEEWDRFRNIDMDKERVDSRTREALCRSFLSELIDGYEECIRTFITDSTDGDALQLHVQDPFHRLLLHDFCEFYNLASDTVTQENGMESWKTTMIKKKKKGSSVLPHITESHFLKMSKEGSS